MRRLTLVALLLLAWAVTGCAGSESVPAAAPEPGVGTPASGEAAPGTPGTEAAAPTAPAAPPAAPAAPSAVSSTVTIVSEPWLTAPARVVSSSREVKITFSAAVDRASVEARLKEGQIMNARYQVGWPSDQELLVTAQQGCQHLNIGVAGAKDAGGRQLEAALNPVLEMDMPCHGGGYTLRVLPDGKSLLGLTQWGVMVDTAPAGERLLGVNGTIYFLLEGGQVRSLARTVSSHWAQLAPDDNVLVGDEWSIRLVALDGRDLKRIDLDGTVLSGILSRDGTEAVLLVIADGQAGFQRLNLAAWTATEWKPLDRKVEGDVLLHWVAGQEQIQVLSGRVAPWLLDLATGQTRAVSGTPLISSPDGRWVVDPDAGAIIGADGRRVALTEAMQAKEYPYALWAPDSQHVLFPGGQVIDVETGREAAFIPGPCGPIQVHQLGKVGAGLVASYSIGCH